MLCPDVRGVFFACYSSVISYTQFELLRNQPMRIAFAASLCLAMFACGQGGSLSGNSGRKTADSRSSRSSGESSQQSKNQAEDKGETKSTASEGDDSNNEESRVVAPEVITGAYLTCGAAVSATKPQPEGVRYFGCIAVDSQKNRIDLENVQVRYLLKDLQGIALDVPTVDLPDADKDIVWAIPVEVYARGFRPEATFPGAAGSTETTIPRKCFLQIGNTTDGFKDQESQCKSPI